MSQTTCASKANVVGCIDKSFIKAREGFQVKGYVPIVDGKPHANSGVTIGSGIDLKERSRQYFKGLGVPDAVIDKLAPYFGMKGEAAQDYLTKNPLELTESQAEDLSNAVMKDSVINVEKRYNAAIGGSSKRFDALTDAQRTVVCSVLFQYGSPTRVPKFWRLATSQDWTGTEKELRNFGDKYTTRRNLEADLLKNDSGKNSC